MPLYLAFRLLVKCNVFDIASLIVNKRASESNPTVKYQVSHHAATRYHPPYRGIVGIVQ